MEEISTCGLALTMHQPFEDDISGVDWFRYSGTTKCHQSGEPFESATFARLCATMYALDLEANDEELRLDIQ